MTKGWVLTLVLRSDEAMGAAELGWLRDIFPNTPVDVELHSTPSGTQVTITGHETTVAREVLPYLCDERSELSRFPSCPGDSSRVMKVPEDQPCSHLVPGGNAIVGRSRFKVTHCKLVEVPTPFAAQARRGEDEQTIAEMNRWLVDQLMKIALSPSLYGHTN